MTNIDELPHRLWLRVVVTREGCWNYTGRFNSDGYGRCTWRKSQWYTHRLAYTLLVGPIPRGWVVDHLCLNRGCCNPAHLEAVTPSENTRRTWDLAIRPGMLALRSARRDRSSTSGPREFCRAGHRHPTEGGPRNSDGSQRCLTCWNLRRGRPIDTPIGEASSGGRDRCMTGLHEMSGANVVWDSGGRRCKACRKASAAASRARHQARRELASST